MQGVHQQQFAGAPASLLPVHGQTAQQHHREVGVARQLPAQFRRQFVGSDVAGRQGVVTEHRRGRWLDEDERSGDTPIGILTRLVQQVAIERGSLAKSKPAR
jgi:hypothetical protein